MIPGCDVLINGKKIESINDGEYPTDQYRLFDCTGKYLIPGLFDSHTHLSFLSTLKFDRMVTTLEEFIRHGVFYVRDVGGPLDVISGLKQKISNGELSGPEIFFTGPMLESSPLRWDKINERLPGFTVAVNNKADVDRLLPIFANHGADLIKTFNNLSLPLFRHILMTAEKLSLRVVHDPGGPLFDMIPIDLAMKCGVKCIEHAKAPWPFVLRDNLRSKIETFVNGQFNPSEKMKFLLKVAEEGIDGVSETRLQALANLMVEQDVILCPTLRVYEQRKKAALTKKNKPETSQNTIPKEMVETMYGVCRYLVRMLAKYGVRMFVGQDGPVAQGTIEEIKLLKNSGLSNIEILKGATIYPARWLGVDDRLGTIEPGNAADIMVLESDPFSDIANIERISMLIHQGHVVSASH